ncbi:response regulator [Nannocystis sp. SCPEA4]|uniref:response regulator n=1 Tax=Nannocystis sp. SCPEA4 TaxID=2996787 RepID=UPI002271C0C7|nr:response regulator [Nannocystis sp. SCPEA4]
MIDDEAAIREVFEEILTSVGYEVSTAESGAAAVERAEREPFELAITDLCMPGLSGVDTVAALRRIKPGLAVIVVSGHVSDESARRCREVGATRFMAKPVDIDELLHAVEVALQNRACH